MWCNSSYSLLNWTKRMRANKTRIMETDRYSVRKSKENHGTYVRASVAEELFRLCYRNNSSKWRRQRSPVHLLLRRFPTIKIRRNIQFRIECAVFLTRADDDNDDTTTLENHKFHDRSEELSTTGNKRRRFRITNDPMARELLQIDRFSIKNLFVSDWIRCHLKAENLYSTFLSCRIIDGSITSENISARVLTSGQVVP